MSTSDVYTEETVDRDIIRNSYLPRSLCDLLLLEIGGSRPHEEKGPRTSCVSKGSWVVSVVLTEKGKYRGRHTPSDTLSRRSM